MDRVKTRLYHEKGKGGYIYIPLKLIQDSSFPLRTGQVITVRINGKRLVIE